VGLDISFAGYLLRGDFLHPTKGITMNAINNGPDLQHHFLIAGEVVFQPKDAEVPNLIHINTVVLSRDGRLAAAHIARAQQALQMRFRERFPDPETQVLDVVITALMPLGVFAQEEFSKPPEGMKLQEMKQALADAKAAGKA
jgi:hypothetical protein